MRVRMLVAAAAALLLAGCGSASGARAGGPPQPGGTSARPACGDAVVTPGRTPQVCVGVGGTLRVQLAKGDQQAAEKGAALTEVAPGVYRGARTGTAELSGFRHACPPAAPGALSCHALAGWRVTVAVR